MKLNKILFSLMAAFSLLAVSCQEEIAYTPGEQDLEGCYGVYFPTQEAAGDHTMDPSEVPAVQFTVKRLKEDGNITVPVNVTASEEGIFQVSELTFADGQSESTITVTFDNAQPGVNYALSLEITDPQYALKYGANPTFISYTVTIERYDLLGMARYREDILTALFDIPNLEWECEVYTKETTPGIYYLKNLYTSTCPFHDPGDFVEEDVYFTVDASDPGKVYIPAQPLGWDWGYGMAWAGSLCKEAGFNTADGMYGTIKDGVIEFPVQGLLFGMENYNDFGFYYANPKGLARIILPGAILVDYSIALDAGYANEGKQEVEFTFGADIETIKYAAYAGSLSKEELAEKVTEVAASTTAATVSKPAADGEGNVPAAVVNLSFEKTGEYTIVAVGYDKDNTAQNSASLVIEYVAAGDEVPVVINAGLGSADKYVPLGKSPETAVEFYIYGSDIKDLKIGLFTTASLMADQQGCIGSVLASQSAPAEILDEVNNGVYVDIFEGLTPGTEYYLIVYAANGYEEKMILSDPITTAGDPLPVYQTYTMNDIADELLPMTSEGYFGEYNYYSKNLGLKVPQTLRNYQGTVTISDSEMPDIPAEEDPNGYGLPTEYVDVKGLYGSDAEYWGFDDTMPFEFYGGVLYSIAWGFDQAETGYYPATMYATPAGSLNFYNYTMIGAFVKEGYIAFVDGTDGQILPTFYLGMFSDEAYSSFAGVGAAYGDALLIDPAVDDNGLVPEKAAASAISRADLDNIQFTLASDANYVETERGHIHSTIDKVLATKQTPKSVGKMAGIKGEWSAPVVEFTAVEAEPVFKNYNTDYKKINDAKPALYR